jgi:hypothetical protein
VFLSLNFHFKIASYEKPILLAALIQTVSWAGFPLQLCNKVWKLKLKSIAISKVTLENVGPTVMDVVDAL